MTTQDIIKQTQFFTVEQKQELLYYLLFSIISEEKRQEFANLFHYKDDVKQQKCYNLANSGAEDFGCIDMENLKDDIYSHL